MITQERLKELLRYCPDTGIFTWAKSRTKAVIGKEAGSLTYEGYIEIKLDAVAYRAHRLSFLYMDGALPEFHVDHKNHKRSDNSWANIRRVSSKENSRNRSISNRNTSGFVGVCWYADRGKWRVQIGVDGKSIKLGEFTKKHDAINARKAANIKYGYHENHGTKITK